MDKINNHNKFVSLRNKYPCFVYENFSVKRTKTALQADFHFDLAGAYTFRPRIEIPARSFYDFDALGDVLIANLVFPIGLVELISYWKAACPPKVVVKCGSLDETQIHWWKKLYFHGLGEFFYLNGIETDPKMFMEIVSEGATFSASDLPLDQRKVLVPVGGGKDSVVSLELLKNSSFQVMPYVVNPREASIRSMEISGFKEESALILNRTLDPTLLQLNDLGFLNGHTPFSALLAFTASMTALAASAGNVALSNENSANQSTVPGSMINHQYSKSLEFENDFREYLNKYVHKNLQYFSFLRPMNELQIATLFAGFPQHFMSFRSCNVGSKTDRWCGHCPKCLFTYIILSPFLDRKVLMDIFGGDLLADRSLEPIFRELTGLAEVKPFECVGTPEEVKAALWKSTNKTTLNALLANEFPRVFEGTDPAVFDRLLKHFSPDHNLSESFFKLLIQAFNDRKI